MTDVPMTKDEWWPVYSVEPDDKYGEPIDLTDELIARARAAEAEFEEVQKLLAASWDAHFNAIRQEGR